MKCRFHGIAAISISWKLVVAETGEQRYEDRDDDCDDLSSILRLRHHAFGGIAFRRRAYRRSISLVELRICSRIFSSSPAPFALKLFALRKTARARSF